MIHPVQLSRWVLPRWKKSGASLENSPPRTSVDLKNLPAVKDFFLAVIQCPRLQKVNPRCDFFTYPSPHELLGGSKSGPSNNGVTQHYVLAGKLWILNGDNARNITVRYEKSGDTVRRSGVFTRSAKVVEPAPKCYQCNRGRGGFQIKAENFSDDTWWRIHWVDENVLKNGWIWESLECVVVLDFIKWF